MRKYYSLLLYLFFMAIVVESIAQDRQDFVGVKGGISIPNLTARGASDNPLNTGYSSRLGPDAVVFWEHTLSKRVSIVPGIEYSSQGGKKSGFQAFPFPTEYAAFFPPGEAPTYLYANFKNEVRLNYLMVNVQAKFNWLLGASSPWMLYVEGGPFGAYILSAKDVTRGNSAVYADEQMQQPLVATPISFDNKMDVKDELHKGNFGITGDVGFAYNFTNSRVFIEAGGNYGLLNIQKGTANGKNQTGAADARVGYAFRLGAK